jgi:glycine cleavage system aminomethyltransferase T
MSGPQIHADFEDALAALCDVGAEFLVVGAYAMSFHGVPRATGDIDVLVRPSPENAERVWRALAAFGAPLEAAGLTLDDLVTPGTVYQMGVAPRRIDVLTSISGVTFDEAWSSRVPFQLASRTIHFIGREALVRNKQASGRPKDLADLEILVKQRAP